MREDLETCAMIWAKHSTHQATSVYWQMSPSRVADLTKFWKAPWFLKRAVVRGLPAWTEGIPQRQGIFSLFLTLILFYRPQGLKDLRPLGSRKPNP